MRIVPVTERYNAQARQNDGINQIKSNQISWSLLKCLRINCITFNCVWFDSVQMLCILYRIRMLIVLCMFKSMQNKIMRIYEDNLPINPAFCIDSCTWLLLIKLNEFQSGSILFVRNVGAELITCLTCASIENQLCQMDFEFITYTLYILHTVAGDISIGTLTIPPFTSGIDLLVLRLTVTGVWKYFTLQHN